jgi:uncharacterized membrane protein
METRIKVLGHPVHPMLVVLPLGLFTIAVISDLIYLFADNADFAVVAYWNIALGVIGGLVAAVFGLIDWLAIPSGTRAKAIGLWHGAGNVLITGLFAVSWFLRPSDGLYAPDWLPAALGVIGVAMALVTAWLGGELVYRLRIGVDDDAHLDASNSLTNDGLVSSGAAPSTARGRGTAAG